MTSIATLPPHSRGVTIDLVLVDGHAAVRQGLRSMLEREPDVRVVGEAGDPAAAMRVVAATRPSLVLIDRLLSATPGPAGLDLCEELTAAYPALGVLVLTITRDDSMVSALRRGARGDVVREVDTAELLRAIRDGASGRNAVDPPSASATVRGLNTAPIAGGRSLTKRELEVLRLLARGLSNGAIGKSLFISPTTAKFHVANILRKLDVGHRAEAVYVAGKMGAL